ncbi:transposable element Tcb1 transposase [Trichonephila clavipes]|nr:transposable element Tcb1 transposase [Trichonephila clavipes]
MSRSSGQSEARIPVFKSPNKLGTYTWYLPSPRIEPQTCGVELLELPKSDFRFWFPNPKRTWEWLLAPQRLQAHQLQRMKIRDQNASHSTLFHQYPAKLQKFLSSDFRFSFIFPIYTRNALLGTKPLRVDIPLRHFRRQHEQLTQFERRRIIGMMEAGWSDRRVASQLGRFDCVVRRCHLHEDQAQYALDRPVVEKTTTSRPLRVLPLKPTNRRLRLDWCRARGNWIAAEWNQDVFSEESRFNLISDDNRVRVWRPRGERLNLPLLYSDTPLLQLAMLGLIWQGCHKTVSALLLPFFDLPDAQICLQSSISGIIWNDASWAFHKFERTTGKVTANME